MKGILCGQCFDFRALQDGPVTCKCGNVQGWWIDPHAGTMKIYALDRAKARVVGVMNSFLYFAFLTNHDWNDEKWKEFTRQQCESADGYLFKTRDCPVLLIGPGNSRDTSWSEFPYGLGKKADIPQPSTPAPENVWINEATQQVVEKPK